MGAGAAGRSALFVTQTDSKTSALDSKTQTDSKQIANSKQIHSIAGIKKSGRPLEGSAS